MTEKLTNHEAHQKHEHEAGQHEHAHKPEVDHANLEKQQKDLLEASRVTAEEHAAPSRLLEIDKDEPKSGFHIGTHHLLKKDSYKSLLKQTQSRLPKASRQFSKIVHQKNIEAISNVGAQTIARPSGLLGGGIGALVGSITLLYTSKHYGFRYNYAFFLVTFLAGFLVGLVVEVLARLVKRRV
jgi:hypothetical protein